MERPRPLLRLNRILRTWWPVFVSLTALCLIATMTFVTYTVVDERRYFAEEAARDRRQDEQMTVLIENQQQAARERSEESTRTVSEALGAVESLLVDQFALHDQNVALKLNDLLHQIAGLLGRPAGTAPNPVHAVNDGSEPAPVVVTPAPTAAPPQPTPTPPENKQCATRPNHPRC